MQKEFVDQEMYVVLGVYCVFILNSVLFPSRGSRSRGLSSKYKSGQADFTDCMSFLLSNLMDAISLNPEVLSANT